MLYPHSYHYSWPPHQLNIFLSATHAICTQYLYITWVKCQSSMRLENMVLNVSCVCVCNQRWLAVQFNLLFSAFSLSSSSFSIYRSSVIESIFTSESNASEHKYRLNACVKLQLKVVIIWAAATYQEKENKFKSPFHLHPSHLRFPLIHFFVPWFSRCIKITATSIFIGHLVQSSDLSMLVFLLSSS